MWSTKHLYNEIQIQLNSSSSIVVVEWNSDMTNTPSSSTQEWYITNTFKEKCMQDQVVVDTAGTGGRIVASVLETRWVTLGN